MWGTRKSEVVLTGVQYNSDSKLADSCYSSEQQLDKSSPDRDSGNDDIDASSESGSISMESLPMDQLSHEDQMTTKTPIVHRDVAKWVEPSGSGSGSSREVKNIAVLGTGDFGRALAAKMVQAGYNVSIGSRNPDRNREFVERSGARLTTIPDAIFESDIVIVAVSKEFYVDLPLELLSGKTVVDVSNRNSIHRKMEISQAEYLQGLVPKAAVVKAFNVLSAYVLENGGLQGSKEVYYAGDVHSAKEDVMTLIRGLGYTPVDRGSLRSAREIEDIPVQRFPNWKIPFAISWFIFLVFFFVAWGKFQICWTLSWDGQWHWGRWNTIPMTTVNSALCCHALTMLALCYLPGVFAAYIQLFRGTKYSRFPSWLDRWLKMRKQLGLLMLLSASLHACLMMAVFSPKYHSIAFDDPPTIKAEVLTDGNWTANQEVKIWGNAVMQWRGECFLTTGVVAFVFAILLGISSLPSVAASLSWKEFAFVQSNLGWLCLIFSCAHNMFYGWPYMNGPSCSIPSSFQYVMYIPGLTILLKIPLILPCVSCHLDKIRGGWESKSAARKITPASTSNLQLHQDTKNTFSIPMPNQYHQHNNRVNGRMINVRST